MDIMDINERLLHLVVDALEDMKALDLKVLDVKGKTSVTDIMVICNGSSSRHVRSLAEIVITKAKEAGIQPLGVEGESSAEWVLVDLGDVVAHIMMPEVREFYQLERLWSVEGCLTGMEQS